ncbi:replication factor C subunit 1-like [Hydractinia symbiolongicarpus]|uniref:replication factor C subunit 1-like n=1 Tax=Hydractinia symbiolongicarpus TaxID=13093 RepID=UPI002551642F|nr:replication factor C subunit 1-like [Hydractinia symbiolongicarpus]
MNDIRSFFGAPNTKKNRPSKESVKEILKKPANDSKEKGIGDKNKKRKNQRLTIESESDSDHEEPLPSKLRKNKNSKDQGKGSKKTPLKTPSKNRSKENDDDIVVTYQTPGKHGTKKASAKKQSSVKKLITPKKEVLQPTTAEDFFSSTTSVKRKKPEDDSSDSIEKSEDKSKKPVTEIDIKDDNMDDPPSKKVKKDAKIQSIQKACRTSPRKKTKAVEQSPVKGTAKSPQKVKKDVKMQSVQKPTRTSQQKKASVLSNNDNNDDNDEIIEPTPPPSKKANASKTSSLASKLSTKVRTTESKTDQVDPVESKMKDSVQKYLKQAKDVDKEKAKNQPDTNKTPQREKSSPKPVSPSAATPLTAASLHSHTPDGNKTPNTPHTDETPVAKKKTNYRAYINREGPSALGSKEMPVGAEDCLQGLTFVLTGVLDAFERDDIVDCVKRYGGKVTTSVSGKTSFVIVGKDPGQSKMEKALKHKTHQLSEDEFLELVRTRPGKKWTSPNIEPNKTTSKKLNMQGLTPESPMTIDGSQSSNNSESISEFSQSQKSQNTPKSFVSVHSQKSALSSPASQNTQSPVVSSPNLSQGVPSLLWVDKYKPKAMKNIVGQQGDKSNANKLRKWLLRWQDNNAPGKKTKSNFYAGKDDGSIFRAALLSGPPGVGKTTSATLVCQDAGFSFIEMNASDTRGKKALETVIKESLSNVTVNGMLQGSNNGGKNHVLIMDEVDGMAGNEDRGGMQELIQLIKKTRIPIICMCNDRNHPKVRSLANHCFDLRFYKPRVEQIKGFALSIASREGLKIPPQAMEQIVVGANQDIRQVVHNLQMWTATSNKLSYDDAKAEANNAKKNIKMGPFDVIKTLFTHSEASKMSINQKSDLFFMDYSFIPLFMQENYLGVNPSEGRGDMQKILDAVSDTADAIADGCLVENLIRTRQQWSLLPLQGLFSTVLPSMKMSGHLGQRIEFPQWLGKNSSRTKHDRILQELKTHMALSCNCMKTDINMDYISTLKNRLKQPLLEKDADANAAAKEVIDLMDQYNLTREDWDSVMEIGKWGKESDDTAKIPTKVKSAFTRLYNKDVHKTPYAVHQAAKKTKIASTDGVLLGEDDDQADVDDEEDNGDDDDISKDAMIKMKKEPVAGFSAKGKGKKQARKSKPTKGKSKK